MKAYIQHRDTSQRLNINCYIACEGFRRMGFEIVNFKTIEAIENLEQDAVVVAGIGAIYKALERHGIEPPKPLDYPLSLRQFLKRPLKESTINAVASTPSEWGQFVKPKDFAKKFTGRVVNGTTDLIGCGDRLFDVPVWVSGAIEIETEWRCFVRYNRIVGVRPYKGDWRKHFDYKVVEAIPKAYENAPNGYAFDVGVTKQGETILVEANDGFSLGSYGLFYIDYAKLLSARWAELNGVEDYCNF